MANSHGIDTMRFYMDFAEHCEETLGVSVSKAVAQIGVDPSTITRAKTCGYEPKTAGFLAMCRLAGLDPMSYLVDKT